MLRALIQLLITWPTLMHSPRQTVSFLRRRFQETGLRPDSRHGQNFLVDLNLLELLERAARVGPDDVVLEVGTGTGSLTARLAPHAAAVVTVEIDQHLYQLASEVLIDFDNVTMLHQDVLKNKNHIHANVLDAVRQQVEAVPGRRLKLVANLPYNIATPVVSNLLTTEIVPVSMTVTIQKELADRMTARPSTKDYSALSIWMQSLCDTEIIRILPPEAFWPRPKVNSAIIHVVTNDEKRRRIPDVAFFHSFVRAMFLHRRKFLRSVVLSAFKYRLDKPAVDEIMGRLELRNDSRAEQLDVEMMLALCELVRANVGSDASQ
jgi:16S rRNA (adenine1518-N6/adenine1519-N6)-dimethyltransferase